MTLTAVILLIVILLGTYGIFRIIRPHDPSQQAKLRSSKTSDKAQNKNHKMRPNRYQRKPQKRERSLGSSPLQSPVKRENADDVLGLKSTLVKDKQARSMETKPSLADFPDALILNLMAVPGRPYTGYELLQALLSSGLRHGRMNIFHRHESKTGRGPILFSLASMTAPGIFDLPKMGAISCKGLTLFLEPKIVPDPMVAYELMLDTASQLVEDLGGDVLDEKRQSMTKEKIAEQRHMIRQLEQAKRTRDLFAKVED